MKSTSLKLSAVTAFIILLTSCQKDYTDPTVKTVATGTIMTIADVRALYEPGKTLKISENISVYGVVTMDESTGNLYKESYITDETGNLYLRFISGTGLYTGDSIRVNINGAKILKYNQMLQVDSLHPDNSIVKIATQQFAAPEITTIESLEANLDAAQGKLIQLNNVWFVDGGQGNTFADAVTQSTGSFMIRDLGGSEIEIRTSGYANFASDTLPSGVGTFIGVVSQFGLPSSWGNALQVIIRDPNELEMNGAAPILVHSKDFEDQSLTSGGWTSQLVSGANSCEWAIYAAANSAAKISNNSNLVCESWLISPAFDLSSANNASIEFTNTIRFDPGPQLQLVVSTNYTGAGDPNLATWIDITATVPANGWDTDDTQWTFVPSGTIDLSNFTSPNVYVAFKFEGTNTTSVTWEVDDVKIYK